MRNDLNVEIGKRLRQLRESAGYSREQMAEMIEISSRFLADLELGTKGMSFHTLIRCAEVLHISTDYLLLGNETLPETESIQHLLCEIDKKYHPELKDVLLAFCNTIQKAKE